MTPVYMPFTYLSAATAGRLNRLVGTLVVYQPVESGISEGLTALAADGGIDIRTPITRDDERLEAALAEFTQWARLNPGKTTAGAGFFSARQGEVPFFDESTINQIRSDIKNYGTPDAGSEPDDSEFSARLFLAVAQDNDRTTDGLDNDLNRFKAMEADFLDSLDGADEAGFNRHGAGGELWREDPGARQTIQRIRAWSTLALADSRLPDLLVTTSPAVVDTLQETFADTLRLDTLATIRMSLPDAPEVPPLNAVLSDLTGQADFSADDLAPFTDLAESEPDHTAVTVTLLAAVGHRPAAVIAAMAPGAVLRGEENGSGQATRHTLILLVQN
ncbi:hypothetical protein [Desulfosarcina ovata]|uniref:Uncharacterized protein n=1 Tax=Desulfosarcina ovata subsp. ovata TaxID=2752305 RepID=A0A5K8AA68_9BACT|nr:hypothetical protein [Desulfosarcina ovata]BBO89358.1 hypothetical protein DSCOOX_25380 [Desulfosarcina ovata subsp. ovata]